MGSVNKTQLLNISQSLSNLKKDIKDGDVLQASHFLR